MRTSSLSRMVTMVVSVTYHMDPGTHFQIRSNTKKWFARARMPPAAVYDRLHIGASSSGTQCGSMSCSLRMQIHTRVAGRDGWYSSYSCTEKYYNEGPSLKV